MEAQFLSKKLAPPTNVETDLEEDAVSVLDDDDEKGKDGKHNIRQAEENAM